MIEVSIQCDQPYRVNCWFGTTRFDDGEEWGFVEDRFGYYFVTFVPGLSVEELSSESNGNFPIIDFCKYAIS